MAISETGGKGIGSGKPPEGGRPLGGRDAGSLSGVGDRPLPRVNLPDGGQTLDRLGGGIPVSAAPPSIPGMNPVFDAHPPAQILQPRVNAGPAREENTQDLSLQAASGRDGESDVPSIPSASGDAAPVRASQPPDEGHEVTGASLGTGQSRATREPSEDSEPIEPQRGRVDDQPLQPNGEGRQPDLPREQEGPIPAGGDGPRKPPPLPPRGGAAAEFSEEGTQHLPNTVAEFVLSSVDTYEALNAPTLVEGDEKFKQAAKSVLERSRLGERLGYGTLLSVSLLVDNDNVVVKRLIEGLDQEQETTENDWEGLRREHDLVEKYFGRRFVPATEFLILDSNLGEEDWIVPGREYVMFQDRIRGEPFTSLSPALTPQLRDEMREFIKRYEHMMREEGAVIQDQIMIDYEGGAIKVSDTNLFHYSTSRDPSIKLEVNQLLDRITIDPQSRPTTADIITALTTSLPELASLREADYPTVMEQLQHGSALHSAARSGLDAYTLRGGFDEVIEILRYFAPPGYHNCFITDIMRRFGINETDLSD